MALPRGLDVTSALALAAVGAGDARGVVPAPFGWFRALALDAERPEKS
jgi:hypothetical protein